MTQYQKQLASLRAESLSEVGEPLFSFEDCLFEAYSDIDTKYGIKGLSITRDGFSCGEASEEELNNLVRRGLAIEYNGEYTFDHLNFLFLERLGELVESAKEEFPDEGRFVQDRW